MLKLLYLEDDANDVVLLRELLAESGMAVDVRVVMSRDAYMTALAANGYDAVISDCSVPTLDGPAALRLARKHKPHTPFIFFSGSVGEEAAIGLLKDGATDYILKDHPARLPAAVERAVREARLAEERCQLEQRLAHVERLDSIGRVVGSVAHDFSNLLMAISGSLELTLMDLPTDHETRGRLEVAEKATQSATALTRQLLAFSRQQRIAPRRVDLNAVVLGSEPLLRSVVGGRVRLMNSPHNREAHVLADPVQLEQVLVNLSANARDAMPDGGTLTISISDRTLSPRECESEPELTPGRYAVLTVADTGVGIPPDVLQQIFEPFFTTKSAERGTGLGLSTCYGIAKQSGGHITVESTPGQGSAFHVYLPFDAAA